MSNKSFANFIITNRNVDQDITGFWCTKCSHWGMFILVKKNKHVEFSTLAMDSENLFFMILILKNQNWWLRNLHGKLYRGQWTIKDWRRGERRLGGGSASKQLYKASITLQTQMISSTFPDSLWTPKSWNVDNRILLLLLPLLLPLLLLIIIMSLQYMSLICLVGDDDDDIHQILQKEGVGHDNTMIIIIIINHAQKKKLAKLSSILVKHKITCSNWLPWNWVSRVHSLTTNMVCMCVFVCTSYNCT